MSIARLSLSTFGMVYTQRAREKNSIPLFWFLDFRCLLGTHCRWYHKRSEWRTWDFSLAVAIHHRRSYHGESTPAASGQTLLMFT